MAAAQTFHQFSSLPAELRLNIWGMNLPGPRIVPLNYSFMKADLSPDQNLGCTSTAPLPANFHTCAESRSEALLSYRPSFPLPSSSANIPFKPVLDVLYFGARTEHLGAFKNFIAATTMISSESLAQVQRLAVHDSLFMHTHRRLSRSRIRDFWELVMEKYKGVVELVVVVDEREKEDRMKRCEFVWEMQCGLEELYGRREVAWDIVVLQNGSTEVPYWPFGEGWEMECGELGNKI